MEWDYDKLFAEGNIVGIKNKELSYTFVYQIYSKHIRNILESENDYLVNWDDFKNENLSSLEGKFEISWIIKIDGNGNYIRKVFDRDNDMFPELKDGMMIWVKTEYDNKPRIGIVVGNKVFYQNGGYDYIESIDEIYDEGIKKNIVSVYNHGGGFSYKRANPIWGQNMNAYLN